MSNTELKSVGEMCDEIKSLKAENKSLKATNKSFRERFEEESSDEETSEEFERGYETCKNDMFDQYDAAVNPLKAEIKSLKEENEREHDGRNADNDENDAREKKLKDEIKDLKLKTKYYQFYLHTMDESGKFDLSKEDVDKFTDDEKLREYLYGEIGYEKYEDDDDWDMSAGFIVKDGEYRINMSGGHEGWYDYVMTKDGCFIHNKDGKKKVFAFVSCPEGNYIKVWDTPHTDGGLSLAEGETDMYQMVKECFQGEIMDYEEEEEEEEKCEECGKVLEGEDKCGKGCPAYDKGWAETHEAEVKTKKKKKKEKKKKTKK